MRDPNDAEARSASRDLPWRATKTEITRASESALILIRADVDVREAYPRVREILRIALQNAQGVIDNEIASLGTGQSLKL